MNEVVYKYLIDQSRLPKLYQKSAKLKIQSCDKDAYKELSEIRDNIVDICEDPDSLNLLICSEHVGNGKTTWATKIMKAYFEELSDLDSVGYEEKNSRIHGMFVPTNQLIFDAKNFDKGNNFRQTVDYIQRAELVIFDDIGAAQYSPYDYNVLYNVIDERIMSERYSIFTTNFASEDSLTEAVGDRLANRIWRSSQIVELKGNTMRGMK